MGMYPQITKVAKYVPDNSVSNHDLSQLLDTSDDWVFSRTGIKSRHISLKETTSDMGIEVAKKLMADKDVLSLDFIIVATMTSDYATPSTACLIQGAIGAKNAFAFDVSAACSGFISALSTAETFLSSGKYKTGIVIGAETMSNILDWTDRSTAVLFGDGAAGVLLETKASTPRFLDEYLESDGTRFMSLRANQLAPKTPFKEAMEDVVIGLEMEGKQIFDFGLRDVSKNITTLLTREANQEVSLDYVLAHQANVRILDAIAKKTKLPREKFLSNVASHGNTSAASIPLLLADSVENGTLVLNSGQTVLMVGFGGGLTLGSLLITL